MSRRARGWSVVRRRRRRPPPASAHRPASSPSGRHRRSRPRGQRTGPAASRPRDDRRLPCLTLPAGAPGCRLLPPELGDDLGGGAAFDPDPPRRRVTVVGAHLLAPADDVAAGALDVGRHRDRQARLLTAGRTAADRCIQPSSGRRLRPWGSACGWPTCSAGCRWSPTSASACRRGPRCAPVWWPRRSARRMDLRRRRRARLLLHRVCSCTSAASRVAHEAAAAFGDDIALNRAVARTNLADPDDVAATLIPEMTRGMPPDAAAERAAAFADRAGRRSGAGGPTSGCARSARDTAGGWACRTRRSRRSTTCTSPGSAAGCPTGCEGDDIAIALTGGAGGHGRRLLRSARRRRRRGRPRCGSGPASSSTRPWSPPSPTTRDGILAEADDGDPRDRMLEVEPAPGRRARPRPSWSRWRPRSATSPT